MSIVQMNTINLQLETYGVFSCNLKSDFELSRLQVEVCIMLICPYDCKWIQLICVMI